MSDKNPIPLWNRICVNANDAAKMMSCCRSTFFARVRDGTYPKPGPDGRWGVHGLRMLLAGQEAAAQAAIEEMAPEEPEEPMPPSVPHGLGTKHLYRHFDSEGALLYVGISFSALHRLAAHKDSSAWFWKIARVEITAYPDRDTAAKAERIAIQRERPLYNIIHSLREAA